MQKSEPKKSIKSEIAYTFIKEKIETGEYTPGDRIVIHDIAELLSISDTPVREAMKRLASESLIEMESHKGGKISPVNIENLEEIFRIRLELETLACRIAVKNATKDETRKLEALVEKMDLSVKNNDVEFYTQHNTEFHNLLYQASHSPILVDLIDNLHSRSERSKMVFRQAPSRNSTSNAEHRTIVEAIREGNEEKAVSALRTQKEFAFATIIDALKLSKKMFGIM